MQLAGRSIQANMDAFFSQTCRLEFFFFFAFLALVPYTAMKDIRSCGSIMIPLLGACMGDLLNDHSYWKA